MIVVVTMTIFVWGLVSTRLRRADLTAPIVFTVVGASVAGLGLVNPVTAPEAIRPLLEITLAWVLFADAARIRMQDFRHDLPHYVRLLAVGLPLSLLAGWGLAAWLFPGLGVWLALLVGAALAPTDAALGVPVVTMPEVPSRIRRLITVESGLNDGIVTPVVFLALAGAGSAEGLAGTPGLSEALLELLVGVLAGVAVGLGGGWLLRRARRGGWTDEEFVGIAVLALALGAYAVALALHGNGFVAAFTAGLAFGGIAGRRARDELMFLEQASGLGCLLVWLAFGAIAVPLVPGRIDTLTVLYAVLSLTVVRMVPVALALIGAEFDRNTVLFVGWFGPRGLASLSFALLALEELGPASDEAVTVIAITVLLSVLCHGVTAAPLAKRYGAAAARSGATPGTECPDVPVRGLPRRKPMRPGGRGI